MRASSQTRQIVAGKYINDLAAVNMKGELARIGLPSSNKGEKLLIITFSPLCSFCRENMPGWLRLADNLRTRDSWRVVWVSRNSEQVTRQYCQEQHLPFDNVFSDPLHGTYLQLDLDTVPNVVALDSGGVVRRVWQGALSSQRWKEIAEYTGVPYEAILAEHALVTN